MAELRYGQVEGSGDGREYPVAASQYFHRRGGKFVYLSAGHVNLCASGATGIFGWCDSPKHATGYDAYLSSSTAGKDKLFVVYGKDFVAEMPYHGTASALLIGEKVGIVNATSATAPNGSVGYTTMQMADIGTTATPLEVVDVDATNNTVMVKIKSTGKQ